VPQSNPLGCKRQAQPGSSGALLFALDQGLREGAGGNAQTGVLYRKEGRIDSGMMVSGCADQPEVCRKRFSGNPAARHAAPRHRAIVIRANPLRRPIALRSQRLHADYEASGELIGSEEGPEPGGARHSIAKAGHKSSAAAPDFASL